MKRDSRLSSVLHILLHMADPSGPVTSDVMARAMKTNPVVVRRTMAGLRQAGIVRSSKGHGGGWVMARSPDEITLADIYRALGEPVLLAMGNRTESPGCLVEQAVNRALAGTFAAAEALMLERFGEVTLRQLATDVRGDPDHSFHHLDHSHAS